MLLRMLGVLVALTAIGYHVLALQQSARRFFFHADPHLHWSFLPGRPVFADASLGSIDPTSFLAGDRLLSIAGQPAVNRAVIDDSLRALAPGGVIVIETERMGTPFHIRAPAALRADFRIPWEAWLMTAAIAIFSTTSLILAAVLLIARSAEAWSWATSGVLLLLGQYSRYLYEGPHAAWPTWLRIPAIAWQTAADWFGLACLLLYIGVVPRKGRDRWVATRILAAPAALVIGIGLLHVALLVSEQFDYAWAAGFAPVFLFLDPSLNLRLTQYVTLAFVWYVLLSRGRRLPPDNYHRLQTVRWAFLLGVAPFLLPIVLHCLHLLWRDFTVPVWVMGVLMWPAFLLPFGLFYAVWMRAPVPPRELLDRILARLGFGARRARRETELDAAVERLEAAAASVPPEEFWSLARETVNRVLDMDLIAVHWRAPGTEQFECLRYWLREPAPDPPSTQFVNILEEELRTGNWREPITNAFGGVISDLHHPIAGQDGSLAGTLELRASKRGIYFSAKHHERNVRIGNAVAAALHRAAAASDEGSAGR